MSDILNTLNSSSIPRGIPRQGTSVSMVSPDADIAALLEQITSSEPGDIGNLDTDSYDEPDDPDVIDDLDKIVASMPAEISAPPEKESEVKLDADVLLKKEESTDNGDEDDLIDSDEEEDEESSKEPIDIKRYILIGVVLIAGILLVVLLSNAFKGSDGSTSNQASPQTPALPTFYADQLTATDACTYQDSMIIEKYIVLDKDACVFVFKGYAENARAFVTAYVDIDTYNRYKTGARVPVLYERISIDGTDYYMKVRVNT